MFVIYISCVFYMSLWGRETNQMNKQSVYTGKGGEAKRWVISASANPSGLPRRPPRDRRVGGSNGKSWTCSIPCRTVSSGRGWQQRRFSNDTAVPPRGKCRLSRRRKVGGGRKQSGKGYDDAQGSNRKPVSPGTTVVFACPSTATTDV